MYKMNKNVYMYVCMYVHYVYMYVCMYNYMYVFIQLMRECT